MGVFKVLQLCLLALSIGAEARSEWSVSDTKDTDEEPHSMQQPPSFETAYEALHQAEAPEFGLEVKHQDPQDFDIMLMTHRAKRSEQKKNRKRPGFQSGLAGYAGLAPPSRRILPPDVKQAPDVVRAKRQLKESETLPKKKLRDRPGKYSVLGRESPPTPVPTESLD